MNKNKTTLLMVLFFFIGLMVLFYPAISNYINEKAQSSKIMNYEKLITSDKIDYDKYIEDAKEFNTKLMKVKRPLINHKKIKRDTYLNIDGTGMIGYITIPKIKVELPIYNNTKEITLDKAAGLLEGTSLPVGGLGTHAVISAHRGLPSSKLFTDLDKLEIGDTFTIKVMKETLTYEVDQILIVKPKDTKELNIDKDNDYVTLMTCTPYGINTHRLLVRAKRIENAKIHSFVSTEAYKLDKLVVMPIMCLPILLLWVISILVRPVKKKYDLVKMFVYPTEYKKEEKEKRKLQLEKQERRKR